jgi:hypothetical protein
MALPLSTSEEGSVLCSLLRIVQKHVELIGATPTDNW